MSHSLDCSLDLCTSAWRGVVFSLLDTVDLFFKLIYCFSITSTPPIPSYHTIPYHTISTHTLLPTVTILGYSLNHLTVVKYYIMTKWQNNLLWQNCWTERRGSSGTITEEWSHHNRIVRILPALCSLKMSDRFAVVRSHLYPCDLIPFWIVSRLFGWAVGSSFLDEICPCMH